MMKKNGRKYFERQHAFESWKNLHLLTFFRQSELRENKIHQNEYKKG